MSAAPRDPHAFWGLRPDHPLRADGTPQARNVGLMHIEYAESIHEEDGTSVPSFNVHGPDCTCYGHLHEESVAVHLALVLSLIGDGGRDDLMAAYRARGWLH